MSKSRSEHDKLRKYAVCFLAHKAQIRNMGSGTGTAIATAIMAYNIYIDVHNTQTYKRRCTRPSKLLVALRKNTDNSKKKNN